MKHFIKIIILLIILSSALVAQETFSKAIDYGMDNEYGTCIKEWDDGVVVFVAAICNKNTIPCHHLIKFNKKGDIIWKQTINYSSKSSSIGKFGLEIMGDNLLVGYITDNPNVPQFIELKLISPEGDSLWSTQIKREVPIILKSHAITTDGNIICAAQWRNTTGRKIWETFIIKIDTSGSVLWEHIINDDDHDGITPVSLFPLPNNEFLMTQLFCDKKSRCGRLGKMLRRMDADGNTIWIRKFEEDNIDVFPGAFQLDNGNYVINYKRGKWPKPNTDGIEPPPCVQVVSPQGDSIWEHKFNGDFGIEIWKIRKANNGDILGCGWKHKYQMGTNGWIFRFSPEGELLWERLIFYDLNPLTDRWGGQLYDIMEDKEGNIWATGHIEDTIPNYKPQTETTDILLYKLSPDGCLIPECADEVQLASDLLNAIDNLNQSSNGLIHVSPNPSLDLFSISLIDGSNIRSWALYNMMGQEVKADKVILQKQITLDFSSYQNGVYLIKIQLKNGATAISKLMKQ